MYGIKFMILNISQKKTLKIDCNLFLHLKIIKYMHICNTCRTQVGKMENNLKLNLFGIQNENWNQLN